MDLPAEEIEKLAEFGEAEAWADSYRAAPPDLAARLGMAVEQTGPVTALIAREVDDRLFNRVVGLGVGQPAIEAEVDSIIDLYRRAGAKFVVQLTPTARAGQIPAWLEARGFRRGGEWAKIYRGIERPPEVATDLRVERAGSDLASVFAEVVFAGFEFSDELRPLIPWIASLVGCAGWRHYLSFDSLDGDAPMGAGALYVRGKVGWLGYGCTLPAHRGRGSQSAIIARRIIDARDMGCEWLVSETGKDTPDAPNPSYRNMLRMGFRFAYVRTNYAYAPSE